jgi:hypothetical protein
MLGKLLCRLLHRRVLNFRFSPGFRKALGECAICGRKIERSLDIVTS